MASNKKGAPSFDEVRHGFSVSLCESYFINP
jgi:hypothetical protein